MNNVFDIGIELVFSLKLQLRNGKNETNYLQDGTRGVVISRMNIRKINHLGGAYSDLVGS
jgi:hypothetical protein